MKYSALIADVVNSQAYEKEQSFETQSFIKYALDWLNSLFADKLKAKAVIRAGDEIQGLFFKTQPAFLYYRLLKLLIFPVRIRTGIGIGGIEYDAGWDSNELRGAAYYNARNAEKECKKNGAEILFCSKSGDDKFINRLAQKPTRAHTETTNLIDTAAEFFYPLGGESINLPVRELDEIIRRKRDLSKGVFKAEEIPAGFGSDNRNKGCCSKRENGTNNGGPNNGGNGTAGGGVSAAMCLNNFWAKGYSTKIAGALGILRQTVDRHIKKHMLEERNADGTVLTYLAEKYDKDTL